MDVSARTRGVGLDRLVAHKGAQRIDEVTTFTGEPGSLKFLVEIPAARIEATSVDQVACRHRTTRRAEAFLKIGEQRCKSAVKSDHEPGIAGAFHGVQNCGELLFGECKRLLDKDGVATFQGLAHQACVRVMPGEDEDGVEVVVSEHYFGIRRNVREAEFALGIQSG